MKEALPILGRAGARIYKRPAVVPALMLAGFAAAVLIRYLIGKPDVAQSWPAALVFALCLYGLCLAAGIKWEFKARAALTGAAGGLFLCVPAVILRLTGAYVPARYGAYVPWAVLAAFVAFAEEAFLRGVLFDSLQRRYGDLSAVIIAAAAFAALHLPLYGWHSVPLDFAVGLWLGGLRLASGSFLAPAIAHILADLAGWWI